MAFSDVNRLVADRVPLDSIVSKYIKLERTSRGFKGLCPFHKEKTASFYVYDDQQYHCFGCHRHGNAITFIMEMEGLSFPDTLRYLAERFGIQELLQEYSPADKERAEKREALYEANSVAADFFHENLLKNNGALRYLADRGVSRESITRFKLGLSDGSAPLVNILQQHSVSMETMKEAGLIRIGTDKRVYPFFFNRLMIPIVQNRKVIGFGGRLLSGTGPKYLNSPDTPVFDKKRNLFALDFARQSLRTQKRIVVTEGYFDVVALHENGFTSAVAALGTAVTPHHLTMLSHFKVPVILLMDGDNAGRKAVARLLDLAIPEELDLRVAFIPEEGEDPDSFIRKNGGAMRMESLLRSAIPLYQHFLEKHIAIYNSTTNVEEKITVEKNINDLLSKIPSSKRRHYTDLVKEKINGSIAIKFISRKYKTREGGNERRRDGHERIHESKLLRAVRELFFIAVRNTAFLSSLSEEYRHIVVEAGLGAELDRLLGLVDEAELAPDEAEHFDKNEIFAHKYEQMDVEQLDTNFNMLVARMKYEYDKKIIASLLPLGTDEAKNEVRRLTEEITKLKQEEIRYRSGTHDL